MKEKMKIKIMKEKKRMMIQKEVPNYYIPYFIPNKLFFFGNKKGFVKFFKEFSYKNFNFIKI